MEEAQTQTYRGCFAVRGKEFYPVGCSARVCTPEKLDSLIQFNLACVTDGHVMDGNFLVYTYIYSYVYT